MVGEAIGQALNGLVKIAIVGGIAIILLFGFGCYKTYDYFFNDPSVTSHHKIVPTLKLTIKDNKVDTFYVYTSKK